MPIKNKGRNGGTLNSQQKGDPALPGAGNPGGPRAKTIITKWLNVIQNKANPVTGELEELSQYDLIALAQLKKALKGDTFAFNALLDRTEGKPKQETEISGGLTNYNSAPLTPEQIKEINKSLEDGY